MSSDTKSLSATSPVLENVDQLLGYLKALFTNFDQHTGIDKERKVMFYVQNSHFTFYIEVHYVSLVRFRRESDTEEGGGDYYTIDKLPYDKSLPLSVLENWFEDLLNRISSTKIREEYK